MEKLKQIQKKDIVKIIIFAVILMLILGTTIYAVRNNNKKTVETDGEIIENSENENIEEIENNIDEIANETNEITNEIENKTNKEEKDDSNNKEKNQNKYYIKVNNSANVVTIYTYDENGNYTKPVKAMICSTGTATPKSGKYKMPGRKQRWGALFGHVFGQYTTDIVGNILFHSVPYTVKGDKSSLEYWEYDKLGTRASAGCVRLTVIDAKWIYDNIPTGTVVEFYSDSNPGPLGKPSAQKISGNADRRGWDPTDPDSKNPWKNGSRTISQPQQNTQTIQEQPTPAQPTTPTQPQTPTDPIPSQPVTPTQPTNDNSQKNNNNGIKNEIKNDTDANTGNNKTNNISNETQKGAKINNTKTTKDK